MGSKLFVGGLAWATDDSSLRQAFSKFGEVKDAKVIIDRDSGRSRGFGFVTFADANMARTAQTTMDGASLDGRSIRVNEAEEKPRTTGGGGNYRSDNGGNDYLQPRAPAAETKVWTDDRPRRTAFKGRRRDGWDD